MMDPQKGCWVGQASQLFSFVQCLVRLNLTIKERVSIGHHPFQSKNHWIGCAKSFGFHNWKDGGQNAKPTKT
jgi:hypothetical protein